MCQILNWKFFVLTDFAFLFLEEPDFEEQVFFKNQVLSLIFIRKISFRIKNYI